MRNSAQAKRVLFATLLIVCFVGAALYWLFTNHDFNV
jgi:hypothetical protein